MSASEPVDPTAVDTPAVPPAPTTRQKVAAEVLGTFVLVFFGCGSAVYAGSTGGADLLAVALAFGIAVLVMAYAVGRISGGHFNPAVTVGAAVAGRIAWRQVPVYVGSQLAGAFLGALVLFLLMQGFDGFEAEGSMGQNFFGDDFNGYAWWAAFLLELVLTAVFVYVVLSVTDSRNEHSALAPLAIGLTLTAIHLVAIPATGTSVNPARSIGPALFAGGDSILQLWLFILAPLLGAAIAGATYPLLFGRDSEPVPGSGWRVPRRARVGAGTDQYQQQWNQPTEASGGVGGLLGSGTGGGTGGAAADAGAGSTSSAQASQWGDAPIVQDGWLWDPQAQQWVPAPEHLRNPPSAQGDQGQPQ